MTRSPAFRWVILGLMWLAAGAFIYADTSAVRSQLDLVARRGLRGEARSGTPMSAAYLPGAIDGLMWARYAQTVLSGEQVRVRHTSVDNAPNGREVHWNSAWTLIIAGAAWARGALTGESRDESLERVAVWIAPSLLWLTVIGVSLVVTLLVGPTMGAVAGFALIGTNHFASGFAPSFLDHNGLINLTSLCAVLGVALACRFSTTEAASAERASITPNARFAVLFAAFACGIGMWVSAAATIPVIAAIVVGALLTRYSMPESRPDSRLWRLWGRVGAGVSLLAYLFEYFPANVGMRLEVNHPLYALAWVAAGELLADLLGRHDQQRKRPDRWILLSGLALLPGIVILAAGSDVFAILDPFLSELHGRFIQEFMPVWSLSGAFGPNPYSSVIGIENVPLLVAVWVLLARPRQRSGALILATVVTALLTLLSWLQMRWLGLASGAQIALTLTLLIDLTASRAPRVQAAVATLVAAVLYLPPALQRTTTEVGDAEHGGSSRPQDLYMLQRDIAAVIRRSQSEGPVTLLTSPNASPVIGYYGGFQTIGTLYWENAEGLKAAAAIFSSASPAEAAQLIRDRQITHIALLSAADFLPQYFALAKPDANPDALRETFGHQLLYENWSPQWLQALPYAAPTDLAHLDVRVALFRVAFDQSVEDAMYYAALGAAARNDLDAASQLFQRVLDREPGAPRGWFGQAGVHLSRGNWPAAADAALRGIRISDASQRKVLTERMAARLIGAGQAGEAIRFQRDVLRDGFDADIACAAAFLLATSADAQIRNGSVALDLAQRAIAVAPRSATNQMCHAAALAEVGRYHEAESAARRAADISRASGDIEAERTAMTIAETFRNGRPLRRGG